jgi:hypothetical protein
MRRLPIVMLFSWVAACTPDSRGWGDAGAGGLLPEPASAPECELCVDTPPATYTGPSTFWIGLAGGAPACPPASPLQGIEGPLTAPTRLEQFARECRITPSDVCGDEGKVCVPAPDADYHTCIHHVGTPGCPAAYPQERRLTEAKSGTEITLCCQPSPIAG